MTRTKYVNLAFMGKFMKIYPCFLSKEKSPNILYCIKIWEGVGILGLSMRILLLCVNS